MLITATNWIDSATITSHTTEQSSTQTPAENVQEMSLFKSYVSNSTSAAELVFDLGAERVIDMIAVLGHNLDQSTGTVRARLSNASDFSSTVYDSTALAAWPTVEIFGFIGWGEFNWGGVLATTDSVDYTISFFKVLPQAYQARYLKINLANAASSLGNIEVGRVFAGPSYRPSNAQRLGWDIQFVDESVVTKSLNGNTFIDERPRFRRLRFTIPALGRNEMFSNFFNQLDRRRGIAKDIIVIPSENDESTFITEAIYGRLLNTNPVENRTAQLYERTVEVEELI